MPRTATIEDWEDLGIYGSTGGGSSAPAAAPVYVQDDDPSMTTPGVWFETAGDEVVTLWVETG